MEWTQFLILIATIAGLFFWNRTESRADYRHMESRTDALLKAIQDEMKSFNEEIKDFHTRLCIIEERRK